MNASAQSNPLSWPIPAWTSAALGGAIAPALAMFLVSEANLTTPSASLAGPALAVGLMGAGMIGAACARRFWVGIGLAIAAGAGLLVLAQTLGMPSLSNPAAVALAIVIASISFAARGALFVCSAGGKGWLIAVFVVAGEAAILITSMAQPGALPDWLLVLLPAQWANIAIQTAVAGTSVVVASSALIALAGTAAATLLVAYLWPRRWPYLIMFTTWITLSALVWHHPAAPLPGADISAFGQAE